MDSNIQQSTQNPEKGGDTRISLSDIFRDHMQDVKNTLFDLDAHLASMDANLARYRLDGVEEYFHQRQAQLRVSIDNHPYMVRKKMQLAHSAFFIAFIFWLGLVILGLTAPKDLSKAVSYDWAAGFFLIRVMSSVVVFGPAFYGFCTMCSFDARCKWSEEDRRAAIPWWKGSAWIEFIKMVVVVGGLAVSSSL